jgi:hypothetical protein
VNPEAKTFARRERQIDQFQQEPLSGVMIPKHAFFLTLGPALFCGSHGNEKVI